MLIARTVMAESGLGGRFWFKAATAGVDAHNLRFKARIGTTQHHLRSGQKKDFSGFWVFGCRASVCIGSERWAKGKHAPRAEEEIYVGFAINTSAWSFYVPGRNERVTTNQVKYSNHEFPFQNRKMVEKHLTDNSTEGLSTFFHLFAFFIFPLLGLAFRV